MTNLRVIDAYLNNKNSEAVIKDAIKLAKPYFLLNVIKQKLDVEARRVFDGFKAEATANDVLLFYLFNHNYPEFRTKGIAQKLLNYNEKRDKQAYQDALFPDQSHNYQLRNFIAQIGSINSEAITVAELEANTKAQYESLKQITKQKQEYEEKLVEETVNQRKQALNKPFNHEDPDAEVGNHPMLNLHSHDQGDFMEIMKYSEIAETMRTFLELNGQEVRKQFDKADWMHVFAQSILSYDLNFKSILRVAVTATNDADSHLTEMQNMLGGGNRNIEWEHLAEYAKFLG